jgi:hypothetical protein
MKNLDTKIKSVFVAGLMSCFASASVNAETVNLFNETFDGVKGFKCDWSYGFCDKRKYGVPTTAKGADNDWTGVRFEHPDNGAIHKDVGVQKYGGGSNWTHTGAVKDDAGLMFTIDTTGFENISLSFDWRTFYDGSYYEPDELVVGYFVGDVTAGLPSSQINGWKNTLDLRNSAHGGVDGAWNWSNTTGGHNGDWIEIFRDGPNNNWSTENILLGIDAAGTSSISIAFWADADNLATGKFDNVMVSGDRVSAVPVPAAAWLFGSGLLGLVGLARHRNI